MAFNETTSNRIAAIASRGLHDPFCLSAEEIRSVCASALTQTSDHVPQNALMGLGPVFAIGIVPENALLKR